MKAVAGLILLFAAAAPAPEQRYFQYQRPVLASNGTSSQTCVAIDAAVFGHAGPQLADLRLYRGGTVVPYALRTALPTAAAETSIAPLNLGLRGKETVFDAAMPNGSYSDLELQMSGQDFLATVTVTGSHGPATSAATTLGAYTIFDLTKQKLGRSTILHLPESDFRELHFRIAGAVTPEQITGLTVDRLPASEPKYVSVGEALHKPTPSQHLAVYEFTVPAHVPVDRLVFELRAEPATFRRDVSITVTPISAKRTNDQVEAAPPVTAAGNLLRVHRTEDGHRIDEEHLAIDAPRVELDTPAKWTISIDNGDDAPLLPQAVRLQMLERDLCFAFSAQGAYTLFYGDAALSAPHYDYDTLYRQQADAGRALLGPETRNAAYEARPDDRPFTEKHPALLWAGLLLTIALLGWIGMRSSGKAA